MRAAAVQLQQTNDMDRNLEAADRLTRAAAADGAGVALSVLSDVDGAVAHGAPSLLVTPR